MRIPTSYNSILVKDFLKVHEILESKNDLFDKKCQIITYFTGKDSDTIPFKYTNLKDRITKRNLTQLLKRVDKLINSEKPRSVKSVFFVGKKRYKTVLDATLLNANQYTAISTYTDKGQAEKNIIKTLGVLVYQYPLFGNPKFNSDKINEIEADLMNARLKDVYGILLFFCKVAEQLNAILPIYLVKAEEEIAMALKELIHTSDLENNTGGGMY